MGFISVLKRRCRASVLVLVLFMVACAVGDENHPGTIDDLSSDTLARLLLWTAPGDNGNSGRATIYFPRYFDTEEVEELLGVPSLDGVPFIEIEEAVRDNFDIATQVPDFDQPQKAGSPESFLVPRIDITGSTEYYLAVRTNDEVGSSSQPSNVTTITTGIQNLRYVSSDPGSCLGTGISAGNYNGDRTTNEQGFTVSVNDYAIGDPCLGRVYIFYGQNDLTGNGSGIIDVSTADVTIIGPQGQDFGAALATASHFESDPRALELVIGAPAFDNGRGKVYVVFGSLEFPSVVNLTDGSVEHIEIEGENQGDNFGLTLQDGAGILNGRGVMMVGAPFFNAATGKVYVFKGPDLSKTPSVNQAASVAHATFTGPQADGFFGFSMAVLGRIDSSSYDEFGIGAPGLGRAYLFRGRSNLNSINLATDDTSDTLLLQGSAADSFGFSITGNGDVDGDFNENGQVSSGSRPDVVVGAPGANGDTGTAFLYSGQVLREAFDNGDPITIETELTGSIPGELFGTAVMIFPNLTPSAQVRNRDTANVLIFEDSNADIAVGAPGSNHVYVFFGQENMPDFLTTGDANLTINGPEGESLFGSIIVEMFDINGDEIDDMGVGSEGSVNISY
ncbi:MAG: hypothetical protein AB7P53_02620 [Candidatus Dadabacteria bacterium]